MITKELLEKQTQHIRELWDKLDPRDRQILMKRADKEYVDTKCDWKALSEDARSYIVRWCYR